MADPRIQKQADIIVNHSLKVKKGEKVVVLADFEAKPLVLEIYKLLVKNGATEVGLKFDSYEFSKAYFENASSAQINHFPVIDEFETKNVDCYIRISAPTNTRGLAGIDSKKISQRFKVLKPLVDHRVEKTRWVITKYPTEAQAQEADMSLTEYSDFVYDAVNKVDWKKKWLEQEKLRKLVDVTKTVRIVGRQTDLTISIKGRKSENAGGEFNMPDGEVFTSAVEDSAEGYIRYSFPALYMGREFQNVSLVFKNGKVVKATASKNESDLNRILNMDRGARYIGELGIGNNFSITKFTKDILFDEKIGGTIHIALGRGYKETLSKNKSNLHWDMIYDLRTDGQLWFDQRLKNRKLLFVLGYYILHR